MPAARQMTGGNAQIAAIPGAAWRIGRSDPKRTKRGLQKSPPLRNHEHDTRLQRNGTIAKIDSKLSIFDNEGLAFFRMGATAQIATPCYADPAVVAEVSERRGCTSPLRTRRIDLPQTKL